MTDQELQSIYENYLKAFSDPSPAGRERLLRASLAEDVAFSNPGVDGRGLGSLLSHVARFQQKFPGGYFRANWLRQQHGHLLAEWTQFNADGTESLTGHSYARLDEHGRMAHLAGFWK